MYLTIFVDQQLQKNKDEIVGEKFKYKMADTYNTCRLLEHIAPYVQFINCCVILHSICKVTESFTFDIVKPHR